MVCRERPVKGGRETLRLDCGMKNLSTAGNNAMCSAQELTPSHAILARAMGRLLSPGGRWGRLTILAYHRVLSRPDPLHADDCDTESFAWRMQLLAKHFNVLSLTEAIERLRQGRLPPRAVCVTFDDGYLDNVENALPVLLERNIRATFFITTGFLDGGCMWNDTVIEAVRQAPGTALDLTACGLDSRPIATEEDRRRTVQAVLSAIKYLDPAERSVRVEQILIAAGAKRPQGLMMCPEHIQRLVRSGMEIGAHTVSHPILARLNRANAYVEIAEGKERLEGIIGAPVRLFAYPNGVPNRDYTNEHVQILKELGFMAAVTTAPGAVRATSDYLQLPRFAPWDRRPTRFMLRLLQNYMRVGIVV